MKVPRRRAATRPGLVLGLSSRHWWNFLRSAGAVGTAACVLSLIVNSCAVGDRHTPDTELETNFRLHESGFEALLARANGDGKLQMLRADAVRYDGTFHLRSGPADVNYPSFNLEDWRNYERQIRRLGIVQITKDRGGIEFRVNDGSVGNGDSYKGYEYAVTPPKRHLKPGLDGYSTSQEDRDEFGNFLIYKPLKGNWYLYLFING